MKKIGLLISIMLSLNTLSAQNLTLNELIPGGSNFIKVENLNNLSWCGDWFIYLKNNDLHLENASSGASKIITLQSVNALLKEDVQLKSLAFVAKDYPLIRFADDKRYIYYNIESEKIEKIVFFPDFASSITEGSNGVYAFNDGQNVWIKSADNEPVQVTFDSEDGIVNGTAVHQNEFGIFGGLFFSPDASLLAFYRMDERDVEPYPIVTNVARKAQAKPQRYPMAGMPIHKVTIGVYNVLKNSTIYLDTEKGERYFSNITFSPEGDKIYIEEINREQDSCQLVCYSAISGEKEQVLLTQTDECYVEPLHPILFLPWDSKKFIRQSETDGYNNLYLYDVDGQLIRQLTKGENVVSEVLGFGKKELFYTAYSNLAKCLKVYAVNVENGKIRCLTDEDGVHSVLLSKSGNYLIDNYSAVDIPRVISLIKTKNGAKIRTLLTAQNPFASYQMPQIKTGTILAADGVTRLNYRLVLPSDFDQTKSYPAIIYVYGGPHVQLVTGGFNTGVRGWDVYMAQKGYVMLTVDSRGSANRGHAFEAAIHRKIGQNEMADQMQGVELLRSLKYVDMSRLAVVGWSYGGFMTTNLMLTHNDVFKVGVAGGAVIDWSRYEAMYGERYMDQPADNEDGYDASNLALRAGDLKGRLLLIHGTMDPVVMWQHTILFLKAAIEAGTHPDYFVYPEHGHNVHGKDRIHLYEHITRYIEDNL